MKRSIKLLIGLGVLLLLIATLLLVKNHQSKKAEEEFQVPVDESVKITQFNADDIVSMNLKNVADELQFSKTVTEGSSLWSIDGYDNLAIKTYMIGNLERMFTSLKAIRVIEDVEDYNAFGLKTPEAVVEATFNDKSKQTIRVGKTTPEKDAYYVMLDGEDKVYTVSRQYGLFVNYTLADFRDDKVKNVDIASAMAYLYMDVQGGEPIEIVLNVEPDTYTTHMVTKPYKKARGLNSYYFENDVIPNFPKIAIDDYVEDGAMDMNKYGLDEPEIRLKAESLPDQEGKKIRMSYEFGKTYTKNEVTYRYFREEGSDTVYGMKDAGMKEGLLSIKAFNLVDSLIYIVNILEVDQINVQSVDKQYTINLERETTKKDDGEDEIKETFFLEGKEIEDDAFRDIYQLIIGLSADFEIREELDVTGSEHVSLTYNLADGSTKVVDYYGYKEDPNFYVTKIDDSLYYAVSADEVAFMLNMLDAVDKGEWPVEE